MGGPIYRATGFILPFSIWGVIIATTFVAMPFLVITLEGALRGMDVRYEGAAATLGAGRWTVMRRVTLPMVAPSLIAGLVLTWARALGEFGATITFAGNLQGRTQTLPLAVFVALESDRDAAVALSLIMVGGIADGSHRPSGAVVAHALIEGLRGRPDRSPRVVPARVEAVHTAGPNRRLVGTQWFGQVDRGGGLGRAPPDRGGENQVERPNARRSR